MYIPIYQSLCQEALASWLARGIDQRREEDNPDLNESCPLNEASEPVEVSESVAASKGPLPKDSLPVATDISTLQAGKSPALSPAHLDEDFPLLANGS